MVDGVFKERLIVNGREIPADAIAAEAQHHPAPDAVSAWQAAAEALAIRQLLLDEADRLGIELPETREYATAAGFALSVLKRLPKEGEHFADQGWRFEVVDMDGLKIDKLLVSLIEQRESGSGD